ncbi:MAG: flagellar biosynthetic protein FliQ [Vulcanimicrobiaceae bacterium]
MAAFDGLVRETFVVCAVLVLPAVIVATIVGTAVAVLQAATQVHEQTLTLLPKIVAVGALAVCFGPAAMRLCGTLFGTALAAIPALVRGG